MICIIAQNLFIMLYCKSFFKKQAIKILLTLFWGVGIVDCAADESCSVVLENQEQRIFTIRLVPENCPKVKKNSPDLINFHIELVDDSGFVRIGKIETKLYDEHKRFGCHIWIAYMSVKDEYRDKGIGSSAMTILIDYYRAIKYFDCFALEAAHWDIGFKTNRVPFYKRLGFLCVDYVDGDPAEPMLMRLDI